MVEICRLNEAASCGRLDGPRRLRPVRRNNDIDSCIEVEHACIDDEVIAINAHGIPVVKPLRHLGPYPILVALPPCCLRQVESFLLCGAGDTGLNRSIDLHMQGGWDITEDEGTVTAKHHHAPSASFLHEAGVLLYHLRILLLSQRDTGVVENRRTGREAA